MWICVDFLNAEYDININAIRHSKLYTKHLTHASKGKAKVLPITGHEGPEGEQRYSSTLTWRQS